MMGEIMQCDFCGLMWVKGLREDELFHRREHAKMLAVLEPKPHKRFLRDLDESSDPELVRAFGPRWRHTEMYKRALRFKREFHYDFTQWSEYEDDPKAHGFLFADDVGVFGRGAIVGACAFRWREWTDHPAGWAMQWIWIAPKVRRHGILTRRWPRFRDQFGDFHLEQPLSEAMQAFADKAAASPLMRHSAA